jgi:nucleoside 2-deoxyribosyltransferase
MAENHGQVLTEHIAFDVCEKDDTTDETIYQRDIDWLKSSDVVIAECSSASLGVGYELGFAEALNKPILCLYRWPRADGKKLSAMIAGNRGNKRQSVAQYEDEAGAKAVIDQWLAEQKSAKSSVKSGSGRLTHLVGWKFQREDAASQDESTAIVKRTLEGMVGVIPTLLDLKVFRGIPGIPGNSDLCLVSHYAGVEEMKAYLVHEAHQAAVKVVVQHMKDRWVIDFFEQ